MRAEKDQLQTVGCNIWKTAEDARWHRKRQEAQKIGDAAYNKGLWDSVKWNPLKWHAYLMLKRAI